MNFLDIPAYKNLTAEEKIEKIKDVLLKIHKRVSTILIEKDIFFAAKILEMINIKISTKKNIVGFSPDNGIVINKSPEDEITNIKIDSKTLRDFAIKNNLKPKEFLAIRMDIIRLFVTDYVKILKMHGFEELITGLKIKLIEDEKEMKEIIFKLFELGFYDDDIMCDKEILKAIFNGEDLPDKKVKNMKELANIDCDEFLLLISYIARKKFKIFVDKINQI